LGAAAPPGNRKSVSVSTGEKGELSVKRLLQGGNEKKRRGPEQAHDPYFSSWKKIIIDAAGGGADKKHVSWSI